MLETFPRRRWLILAATVALALVPAAHGQADNPFGPITGERPAVSPPTNALDKADLEFYIRHLHVWGPEISVEVSDFEPTEVAGLFKTTVRASHQLRSQNLVFYVSRDGQNIMQGTIYEVDKNPFRNHLDKIDNRDVPAFGKEGAPVVLAVYSDFQCPYCAKEGKLLRTQVPAAYPENVRVYYHDYPLSSHNWAMQASIAGRCIYSMEPQAFWRYHDWVFDNQKNLTPQNFNSKVGEFAGTQGLDSLRLSPCLDDPETRSFVEASIEEGRKLGVSRTPTVFINGRKAGNLDWKGLKRIIDYELEYQKVTKNAGDDCGCEVEADFPGQP